MYNLTSKDILFHEKVAKPKTKKTQIRSDKMRCDQFHVTSVQLLGDLTTREGRRCEHGGRARRRSRTHKLLHMAGENRQRPGQIDCPAEHHGGNNGTLPSSRACKIAGARPSVLTTSPLTS